MPQSEFWAYSNNSPKDNVDFKGDSSILQKQLGDMEGEVKEIQMELAAIKQNRLDLHERKLTKDVISNSDDAVKDFTTYSDCRVPFVSEFPEVGKLREELTKAKNEADQERFQREKYETKLKDLEHKLNTICSAKIVTDMKDHRKFTEEEVIAMKTQIRDMKEEIEEMKITVVEKTEQLQDYRVKYLQAQQQVEELRRQLDVIEYDNKQVSDQIQIEIKKMKMQFQEKLQELAPLPDLLKGAQIQLHEAKQMQRLTEDSSQQLTNELHHIKEKLVVVVNSLNYEKADRVKLFEENKVLNTTLEVKQKEIDELSSNLDESKRVVLRLEEKLAQQDLRFTEKSNECMKVLKDLEDVRVQSDRSLSRCKDRADSMRRYLQTQISEIERQLIQSRAQCRACQKERDEMRQRMQSQVNNLQENFELVEMRLRALQNQVSRLKSNYTVILSDEGESNEFTEIATTSPN